MTVLTEKEIKELKKGIKVEKADLDKYFKKHPKLKRNPKTIKRVTERIKASRLARSPGKEVSFTQSAAEWQIIYGQQVVGGAISFVARSGANNQYLHMVITIAGHQITSVDKLYLDDEEVIFGASPDPRWSTGVKRADGTIAPADNVVFMSPTIGVPGATNSDLMNQQPTLWTTNHRQEGCSFVYLILKHDPIVFPNGVPEFTFLVSGKPVTLPNGNYSYSTNAAAVIRDYLTDTRFGMGIPADQIDATQYSIAYNKCNELVLTYVPFRTNFADTVPIVNVPQFDKRYTIDGVFKSSDSPQEVLDTMCAAMGGTVIFVNGLWKIYPAAWRSPTITLTENDVLSDLRVQTKLSRADSFNGVRGTFFSPSNKYEETDFPAVKNDYYMSLDNNERVWEDVQFPVTNTAAKCQRLAKIELERNRQAITVQATFGLRAYLVEPLDTVKLTFTRLGWNEKIFEVQQCKLNFEGGGGGSAPSLTVELLLRETAAAVFEWAEGTETVYDLSTNTLLPDPRSVAALTGLVLQSGTGQLYVKKDGSVFSRLKISWNAPDDFFVTSGGTIRGFYRRVGGNWQALPETPATLNEMYILDVEDGVTYEVRIYPVNALRVLGPTITATHTVVGKTAAPSVVNLNTWAITANKFGINFDWDDIPDLDRSEYEIRVGNNFATGQIVWRGKATVAKWEHKVAGTYQFWIAAIDTSGNYSPAVYKEFIIEGPSAPVVDYSISGPDILFTWSASTGPFEIADYVISHGPDFESSVIINRITANNLTHRADFGGSRTFWIVARDIAQNPSPPAPIIITISLPNPVIAIAITTLRANVLLDWKEPNPSSLPIDHYNVYKGDNYSESVLIGTKYGTFHAYLERFGGTFGYHVEAVDTAGNVGPVQTIVGTVVPPQDFYIKAHHNLLVDSITPTLVNAVSVPKQPEKTTNEIYFPVETISVVASSPPALNPIVTDTGVETFEEWWDRNGWDSLQDAVSTGDDSPFLAPLSPAGLYPGKVSWTIDYEVTFSSSFLNFQYDIANIGDLVSHTPSIKVSADGATWVDYYGATQVFATDFRYVEYSINFEATSTRSFARLSTANATVSLEREKDYITITTDPDDNVTGGTPFVFTKNFLDVEDIQATTFGSAAFYSPVVNFEDVPNPTQGKVLVYDKDGELAKVPVEVRIQVTGAVNS